MQAGEPGPVTLENRHAGSTDWILDKIQPIEADSSAGRYVRRPAIEAYCSHRSIEAGETLTVYVSTDPASVYNATIYRMGYYGGKGGRRMKAIGPLEGNPQPLPEEGPKNLMECDWEPGFQITIPDNWLSGVYLGKLTASKNGYQSYFVFIVRDNRQADLLFQCSDLTWQAYNRWPQWHSLYDWEGDRWHTDVGADVSFNRPYSVYYNPLPSDFNRLSNGSGEFLLWEFPLAFWLEKNGYNVTYISNLDTHRDPKGLLRAEGFLSVGHDEYWTEAMFRNVQQARRSGVDLAFLSGNSVYWKVYLRPGTDGAPHRTVGRIGRFEKEAKLLGATSYGVGAADWTCTAPEHWLFNETGMEKGDSIPELVGWEYHGPPLLESPEPTVLAKGPTNDRPEKPYAATIYNTANQGFVFNAATCWWSMMLASPPGFQNPPDKHFSENDPRARQITHNLLNRMIDRE